MSEDIDAEIAARIAAEMRHESLPPLTPEEVEQRELWLAEQRVVEALGREAEAWHRQQVLEERQRLEAEAEALAQRDRQRRQQREIADRMQARQTAQAATEAAQHAAQTRTALARQELERRQRLAFEEQVRFFKSLGPMFNEPKQPTNADLLARIGELEERLAEPEPTLVERLTRPFYEGPLLKDK